jgi:hypothetical protein
MQVRFLPGTPFFARCASFEWQANQFARSDVFAWANVAKNALRSFSEVGLAQVII